MNIFISSFLIVSSLFGSISIDTPKLRVKDLQLLTGNQWTGTLTYLDYRTNKKVSIASNLLVSRSNGDKLSWVFEYQYPDEPKANGKEIVTISKDGGIINGEKVVERVKLAGNTLRIVTEKNGSDNDKKALFRFTYLIGPKSFSIKKDVRYEGAEAFIERNQFSWRREAGTLGAK